MSRVNTYWQIGYNLDPNLFGAASPVEVLVEEPAINLAMTLKDEISRGVAPSSTSTSIKPYVVVPLAAASIKNSIPKYQRQYFARVEFATLMGTIGISLKPVLIDNPFIQLWTADLNESQADYLRGQSYIITSVFPESFGTYYTGDRGRKKASAREMSLQIPPNYHAPKTFRGKSQRGIHFLGEMSDLLVTRKILNCQVSSSSLSLSLGGTQLWMVTSSILLLLGKTQMSTLSKVIRLMSSTRTSISPRLNWKIEYILNPAHSTRRYSITIQRMMRGMVQR